MLRTRSTARHRADRDPLATLTGTLRAVTVDAPRTASRSVVAVATTGGIMVSALVPVEAASPDPLTESLAETTSELVLGPELGSLLEATGLVDATPKGPQAPADDVDDAAPAPVSIEVVAEARIDSERVDENGAVIGTVDVTPAPPPPPPPPAPEPRRAPAASRTAPRPEAVAATAAPSSARFGDAASLALRYLGTPYVFGSSNPAVGLDCSGLVVHVFRQLGVSLPHQSTRIRDARNTVRVSRAEAQPGDIIWSPGHVSIYLGGGRQVEATRPGGWTVRTSNVWQSNPHFLRVTG